MLQSMGSQRVEQNWATEQQQQHDTNFQVIYSILQNLCFHMAFCVSISQKSKAIYRVYIFNNDTGKYFASCYYSIWAS